jgi:hypothetical protein
VPTFHVKHSRGLAVKRLKEPLSSGRLRRRGSRAVGPVDVSRKTKAYIARHVLSICTDCKAHCRFFQKNPGIGCGWICGKVQPSAALNLLGDVPVAVVANDRRGAVELRNCG